ncbi:DUF551 domain-containing protein [Klebsiella variicola subsp. variicola]|uniref:DUF551 domain-containing protein n=1 Tax=Klebsiella variicola TaxID=244366 RepID=UPI00292BDE04|nr:DUF551 domain-containing protein [Klebsiella variicola]MDV0624573.1 DUF551 domain-containing protein [Klebsiella variicola subsp. variicola]
MTKSTITRERLQEIAEDGFLKHGESKELARMALAAMDSEPVAYISKSDFDAGYPHILARRDFNKACTMAVYAAQPAPDLNSVSINDNHPLPNPPAENGIPKTAYCGEGLCLSEPITPDTIEGVLPPEMIARGNKIVNPRSAGLYLNDILHPAPVVPMENHIGSKNSLDAIVSFIKSKSNPTVKCYEEVSGQLFKDNCHGIHSHVIEYILKLGEELEDLRAEQAEMQSVLVVPDELKEAAADFLTVLDEYPEQLVPINRDSAVVRALRAAMLAAAPHDTSALNSVQSVVTVPGKWIPVSERIPEDDDFVYIWPRPDFGVELHVGQYCERSHKGGGWYAQVYEQNYGIEWHPITVTHWMPLPAGPQEVR